MVMKKSNLSEALKSNQWMEQALELARRAAAEDEVPVGAIVVREGKVIGRGYNRREQDNNPCSHAEIEAILDATRALDSWRLEHCRLVVTLEPCLMCLGACQQARVAEVIYGAADPKGGALSLGYRPHEDTRLNHRFSVRLEDSADCGQVLRDFFARKRGKIKK